MIAVGFFVLDVCAVVFGAEFDGFSVFVGCAVVGGAVVVVFLWLLVALW